MTSHNAGRMAIITGGATIVFQELLDEVVSAKFFRALVDNGFETVLIQTGAYEKEVNRMLADLQPLALEIEVVPFLSNMKDHMELCRGLIGGRPAGVVISHAGTGTIADCWEVNVANIIVANPNLMDNHQAAFAEDMARNHPTVILGRLGKLDEAVKEAIGVIQDQGLDKQHPLCEPTFPVAEESRLRFVDDLIFENH